MNKKSWIEKLNNSKDLPQIKIFTKEQIKKLKSRWNVKAGDTMIIPSPLEVNQLMKKIPKGKLITINEIRNILSKKYNTTITCPITTGIFAWISANAAEEELKMGRKRITPYWRTLKSNGEINQKYPGGIKKQIKMLEKEGFEIICKGTRFYVKDYERYLVKNLEL